MSYYDIAILILPIMLVKIEERKRLDLARLIIIDIVFILLLIFHDGFSIPTLLIGLFIFTVGNIRFLITYT